MKSLTKKKLIFLPAVAMTVLFSAAGCKGQSAHDVVRGIQNKANEKKNEFALSGSWVSNCEPESIVPKFKAGREVYKFNVDGTFERRHYFFSESNCQSPSFVRIEKGGINFPETRDVKDGTPVDFSFKKVEVEVKDKTVADVLNSIGYCDTHFDIGQKTDLTNASRLGLKCVGIKRTPRNTFTTMKLNGGQLLVAGDASEESVTDRPDVSDHSKVYVKGDLN